MSNLINFWCQKSLWEEALSNNGIVNIQASWWDSDGSKIKKIQASDLSQKQVLHELAKSSLIDMPPHYYRGYSDSTWDNIASKSSAKVISHEYSCGGGRIDGIVQLNLHIAYGIESNEELDAVNTLLSNWSNFATENPFIAQKVRLMSGDKKFTTEIEFKHDFRLKAEDADLINVILKNLFNESSESHPLYNWLARERSRTRSHVLMLLDDNWFSGRTPTAQQRWGSLEAPDLTTVIPVRSRPKI